MKRKILPLIFSFISLFSYAADWSKVSLSLSPLKDFAFLKVDENTCYAFAIKVTGTSFSPIYSSHIYKTSNGGSNWDSIAQSGLNLGSDVKEAFMAGSTMYVLGTNGLYKSTNDGANWAIAASDYSGIYAPTDVSFDGTNIYISVWNGLYVTNNHFTTLKNINYNVNLSGFKYQFMCAEKLNGTLIGGINSKVYYLEDTTWKLCTGVPDRLSNFNMLAYENGNYYLSDRSNSGYYLYHSTDGKAWTQLEQSALSDVTYTGNTLYATKVATSTFRRTTISVSNKTITDLNSDLPTLPITNGLVVLGNKLFTGLVGNTDNEAGMYVRTVSGQIVPPPIKETANDIQQLNIWPNPTTNLLNIASENDNIDYYITNMQGQKISSGKLVDKTLNIECLGQGIYQLIVIDTNGQKSSALFIKQ